MIQAVLDIETLGLPKKGAIPEVLAIGAMIFDDMNPQFKKYFYRVLLPNRGYIDKSTKEWWLKQNAIVKRVTGVPLSSGDNDNTFDLPREVKTEKYNITFEKVEARQALKDFRDFCIYNKVTNYWANSPTFDCRIVEELGMSLSSVVLPPWYNESGKNEFWRQRDIRTIKDICDQFKIIKETYSFLKIALEDFREIGINKLWNLKHFALYDCVSEASIVCASQEFLYKCQVVLEG